MDWFITYEDAEKKVAEYLQNVKNLSEFCKKYDLCYQNVAQLKLLKNKGRYTNIVMRVLEIMGFQVEKKICFTLKGVNLVAENINEKN